MTTLTPSSPAAEQRAAPTEDEPAARCWAPLTPRNAMSVDVEDWFHALEPDPQRWDGCERRLDRSVDRLLEIFAATGTKATFFVIGRVAAEAPGLVRRIHAAGHEIGSHGHAHRFVYGQTPESFADDVRRSVDVLASITGQRVRGYRAPHFSITRRSPWALPVLQQLGLEYDSSLHPGACGDGDEPLPHWPHRLDGGLLEAPVTTCRCGPVHIACGGLAFRALPYGVTAKLLGRFRHRTQPIVFYVRPWELDPGQPRLGMAWSRRLRQYHGLQDMAGRLRRLCEDFAFGPIGRALTTWET